MQFKSLNQSIVLNVSAFKTLLITASGDWSGQLVLEYSNNLRTWTPFNSITGNGARSFAVSSYQYVKITAKSITGEANLAHSLVSNVDAAIPAYNILDFAGMPADNDEAGIGARNYIYQSGNAYAGGLLTFTGNGQAGEEIVVGEKTISLVASLTEAKSSGSVTSTNNGVPTENDIITIGSKIYRWRGAGNLAQANDVLIGADGHACLDNLKAALDLSGTPGTEYHAATTANAQANAPQNPGNFAPDWVLTIVAIDPGVAGDAIVLTTDADNMTVSGTGTLANGVDPVAGEVKVEAALADTIDNIVAFLNGGAGEGVKFATGSTASSEVTAANTDNTKLTVTAKVYGDDEDAIATTTDCANGSWGAATLVNGDGPVNADDVLRGVNLQEAIANLIAAINNDGGEGTLFGTGTVAHAQVYAEKYGDSAIKVIAKTAGAAGNLIAVSKTAANLAWRWGNGTLVGGSD